MNNSVYKPYKPKRHRPIRSAKPRQYRWTPQRKAQIAHYESVFAEVMVDIPERVLVAA